MSGCERARQQKYALMMGTEMVPETLVVFNEVTPLIAR
jgi:hypothetical protein